MFYIFLLPSVLACAPLFYSMNEHLIWWAAVGLESAIIFRGFKSNLMRRYPLFYVYVACILLVEFLRFSVYHLRPDLYPAAFWCSEPITVIASYAVILEIFRTALKFSFRLARLAQTLLCILFVIAFTFALSDLANTEFSSIARATAELGRDLRYVEGALLLVMLWLFGRYRIVFGHNLLGLVLGYSLFVGVDVIDLALLFHPANAFSTALRELYRIAFLLALSIWCATLWSAKVDTQPTNPTIQHEYELLETRARTALAYLSTRVARTLRP